ncbi:hypothetical protein M405DRAFT_814607 [Rhizopogon salebrosus TDB-379]|nr:hypothetical protein M405DRAFT_814607 [Rhizopogon salebrosus TDB-379]
MSLVQGNSSHRLPPFRLAGVRNKPPPRAKSSTLARATYLPLGDPQVLSWPTAQFLYQ